MDHIVNLTFCVTRKLSTRNFTIVTVGPVCLSYGLYGVCTMRQPELVLLNGKECNTSASPNANCFAGNAQFLINAF